ncbi:MAG: P-loop NTPase, partial [Syntrophomonadaceae bacterium]|nr:P-loop NTPase [Syntrophomonadaceae bacterium]
GVSGMAQGSEAGLYPMKTSTGIDIISVNLLLENDTDPVIWRGPIIAGAVKQFWTDVIWENVDFMFIDMPPGTGDVPLTVFQSIRVDGIIIVTSPQELVSMIVSKAVKMAEKMNIPIIGLVENMAYFQCPDCGKDHKIFGDSHIDKIARRHDLEILSVLPLDPELAVASDNGNIENYEGERLERIADILEKMLAEEIPARKAAKPAPAVIIEREGGNELKIAVASDNNQVAEHFGHCEKFNIYVADNGQIVKDESVPNPGHKPGFLPVFLHEQGVDVIISGGMGGGAIDLFNENNIEVIVGARGDARTAAEEYLKGELKSTGSVCHEHQHHDECGH